MTNAGGTGNTTVVQTTLEQLAHYGNLVSQRRGSASSFHLFDALGSTDRLTTSLAIVTDSYIYQAFGALQNVSGATANPYRFVGMLQYAFDLDTGLLMLRRRQYGPSWQRFTSLDPLFSDNRFRYSDNNPVRYVDPLGLFPIPTGVVVLIRDVPIDAKCCCIDDPADCFIDAKLYTKNVPYFVVAFRNKVEHVFHFPNDYLSKTYSVDNPPFRQWREGIVSWITLKSKSKKDVRGCHLQQDVYKWYRTGFGRVEEKPESPDYSSSHSPDNVAYGRWWILDGPFRREYTDKRGQFAHIFKYAFWQAHVFVEEAPRVQMYYGYFARADFTKNGAEKDALEEKKTFGPQAAMFKNPYAGLK
jgi:RHS repeat-associated protein